MMNYKALEEKFLRLFGGDAADIRVFCAPGRVNLIGEHIDYNGGRVLPAAIERENCILCRPNAEGKFRLAADDLDLFVVADPAELEKYRGKEWESYPLGIAWALREAGYNICGLDMLYWGNVPFGAGLSSSASIEVATALCMAVMGGCKEPDLVKLSLISQRCENAFVGVNCGIMDQFACAMGKKNACIRLDCATLAYDYAPLELGDYRIVIGNTNKKRSLADSKYNERRGECETALADIQKADPSVKALCELSVERFAELSANITDETCRRRALHCVEENDRVNRSVVALGKGDLAEFGRLLNASHASLKDLYEVTGAELDALAETAQTAEGCIGSRMTGAGFGGCTVSLVREDCVDAFIASVGAKYTEKTGLVADFYVTGAANGAREITAEVR